MKLTLEEVAFATGGTLIGENIEITNICTDSRIAKKSDLFIPIIGENFDGHKFIEEVINKGASAFITSDGKEYNASYVKVNDTRIALGDIARYYKEKFDIPFIAITGSVGKTTTKDIIESVLSRKYKTLKTEGNFNNDIGVPLTLFRLSDGYECAVIEMGMNHFDEISYLSSIVKPDIGVITNVGVSHIENLGSRDGILKAKTELFDHMQADATKILNGDDDKLITISDNYDNIEYFSINDRMDLYADNIIIKGINGVSCDIHKGDISFSVDIKIPGKHMVSNALAATAVGLKLGLTKDEIKAGIENFVPTKMRMDIVKKNNFVIINDVYNSNPQSVMAGIEVLASTEGATCAILGDMLELGEKGPKLHYEVGQYAVESGIDTIICIGEISRHMYQGGKDCLSLGTNTSKIHYFKTQDEFFDKVNNIIPLNSSILVKASRGMHFERITERLNLIDLEKTAEKLRGEINE